MFTNFSRSDFQLQLLNFAESFDRASLYFGKNHHLSSATAEKTFQWFATDQPDRLNPQYEASNEISYKFNKSGYRCDDIQSCDYLFIGCSFSFGVGLPIEDVWSYRLAEFLKVPYINLSYPGGSLSYILRTVFKTFEFVRPKKIFALIPYNYRFEFISSVHSPFLKVWSKSGTTNADFISEDKERIYAYEIFTTKENEEFEFLKALMLLNTFLEANGCQLFWTSWEYDEKPSDHFISTRNRIGQYLDFQLFNFHKRGQDLKNKARDSTHPTAKFHHAYFDFLKNYV